MTWEKQIILAGYKALAVKHHPDKGGKDEDFKNLTVARDHLLECLRAGEGAIAAGLPWKKPSPPQYQRVTPVQTPEELLARLLNLAEAFVNPKRPKRRR